MELIRVDTKGNISRHEYPVGDWKVKHTALTGLIGEKCDMVEMVRPGRLYKRWGGIVDPYDEMVNMLVDESGMYHGLEVNEKASALYGYSIMGNVLFIGEEDTIDGPDFAGLTSETADKLEGFLRTV